MIVAPDRFVSYHDFDEGTIGVSRELGRYHRRYDDTCGCLYAY
jgi:hypothetical protein